MKKNIIYIILIFSLCSTANAARVGEAGLIFLTFPPDAKSAALGGMTGTYYGNDCTFANPAGIGFVEEYKISASHAMWLDTFTYNYISTTLPFKAVNIGFGFMMNRMKSIKGYDGNGLETGNSVKSFDNLFSASISRNFPFDFSIGVTMKLAYQKLADFNNIAFAFDVSLMKRIKDFNIGISANNFGFNSGFRDEKEKLPVTFKLFSNYLLLTKLKHFNLDIGLEFDIPLYNKFTIHAGIQPRFIVLKDKLDIIGRVGYEWPQDVSPISGLTAGMGLEIFKIGIDYAFVYYDSLKSTHRITLSYSFRGKRNRNTENNSSSKVEETAIQETELQKLGKANDYMVTKNYDKALKEYKKIIKNNPSNIQAKYNIACIYSIRGDTDKALKIIIDILNTKPDLAEFINNDKDLINVRNTESYKNLIK